MASEDRSRGGGLHIKSCSQCGGNKFRFEFGFEEYKKGNGAANCISCNRAHYFTPPDPVNHPPHYTSHPSGIEAIQVCEHFTFNIGNAIKYCWREGLKGDSIEDLKKARWYLKREIKKRKREAKEAKK
ncbi:DUF3310 domain-containing protein [Allorhodopirellula solitaria]|nr:DUF3310 domain-containing protein [Allorhodopirellula solitaria]